MQVLQPDVSVIQDTHTICGESVLWSEQEAKLYWVDCNRPELSSIDLASGKKQSWLMPRRIGGVVLAEYGKPVVALSDGIYTFDTTSEKLTLLAPRPFESDHLFLHEARCDRAGRLWVGLLNQEYVDKGARGEAQLFTMRGGALVRQPLAEGGTVSNGLAWSPTGDRMYYADTPSGTVWIFDYDNATGDISNKRIFLQLPSEDGLPDGAAVDSAGGYWSCLPFGSSVARYFPDGSMDRKLLLPVEFPTMPAFAGAAMDTLYVNSLSFLLSPQRLAESPANGSMLKLVPGFTGMAETPLRQY